MSLHPGHSDPLPRAGVPFHPGTLPHVVLPEQVVGCRPVGPVPGPPGVRGHGAGLEPAASSRLQTLVRADVRTNLIPLQYDGAVVGLAEVQPVSASLGAVSEPVVCGGGASGAEEGGDELGVESHVDPGVEAGVEGVEPEEPVEGGHCEKKERKMLGFGLNIETQVC